MISSRFEVDSESLLLKDSDVVKAARGGSFKNFVAYSKPDYQFNWHNKLMMKKLESLAHGHIRRLMIFAPPRHGKSELVSRQFPAFCFGLNPDLQMIGTSYAMDLAAKMNRDIQRVMATERYRAMFPYVTLGTGMMHTKNDVNYLKNTHIFEITNHRGMYRAAGVGTGITGMGFDLGSIDDPIKDQNEALSQRQRDKVWDWFTSTFYTRAQKNARMLITLTRWHEDDLAGRIQKRIKAGEDGFQDWEILNLPAIAEEIRHPSDRRKPGEALWPSEFNLDMLNRTKHTLGSRWWNALYQQRPSTEGGNMVKRGWFKWYDPAKKPARFDEIIQSWDCTFKENGSSYVVGQVWGKLGPDCYLLDQIRAKMGFVDTLAAIRSMSAKHPTAIKKLVEAAANGQAIIQTLSKEMAGIIGVPASGSKEARASAASPLIEAGNVWLPLNTPWTHDYVEEWLVFPNGENDDQVDASTQALIHLNLNSAGKFTDDFVLGGSKPAYREG